MAFWLLMFLPLVVAVETQAANQTNETDLQVAMADMRTGSYHGFVILLRVLNREPNRLWSGQLTFLMPKDDELSKHSPSIDHLETFVLSHSIPTALLLNHLLHFPNGTLVPSGVANRMITITNNGRAGLFMNNAKIITPNVCSNSKIQCHGLSTAINFDSAGPALETKHPSLLDAKSVTAAIERKGRSTTKIMQKTSTPH